MIELNTWAGLEPAVMDIKTVSGLAQVFELTLTDSTGSAVDLDGVTFRGAVNTAPLQEFICSTEKGKVLFGWTGLPAGRHSFDLFMVTGSVEKALIHGAFVVAGRVLPPLDQESYSVNNAATVVFPGNVDGMLLVELSEVGLVDLLSRRAGAFTEEAKGCLGVIRELKEWIGGKVDGFGDVVETASMVITEAGTAAVRAVEVSHTEAVRAVSAEKEGALTAVNGAGETTTKAITEAGTEAVKTVSAKKDVAVSSIQTKQADSVLAVGRASRTAQQNIASAQGAAVLEVQDAQQAAEESLSGTVKEATDAKTAAQTARSEAESAAERAGTSASNAAASAAAAQQALEAIPQVDASGNMTLAGGLTTAGTHNANGGINIPVSPVTDTHAARLHEVRVLNEIANGDAGNYFDFSTPPFGSLLTPFAWRAIYWPKPQTDNGWVDFNFRCNSFGQDMDRGGSYTGATGIFLPLSTCLSYQRMFNVVSGGIHTVTLNESWAGPDDHPFSDPTDGVSMWWDVYFLDLDRDNKIPVRGRFCRLSNISGQVEVLSKTVLLPANFRLRGIAVAWGLGHGGMWIVGCNETNGGRIEAYRLCDDTWSTSSYRSCINTQRIRLLCNRGALEVGVGAIKTYVGTFGKKNVVAEWCEMMEVK